MNMNVIKPFHAQQPKNLQLNQTALATGASAAGRCCSKFGLTHLLNGRHTLCVESLQLTQLDCRDSMCSSRGRCLSRRW
jgi:hypothetical protein